MTAAPETSLARAELVAAAAHAFAEHGYHGVSVRHLARALGRAPATFYSHFPSKEELLFSLQRDAFDTLVARTEAALAGLRDPAERLDAFVLHHLRYVAESPDVMRVLVRESTALPPRKRAAIRRRKEAYFGIARRLVADLVPAGEAAELDRITYCLFGMLNWTFAWYRPEEHGPAERLADTIARTLMHGIDQPGGPS